MASKTFVTSEELLVAQARLQKADKQMAAFEVSHWLGQQLENQLKSHKQFEKTKPYMLGSWARGELCAKSDIDLLLTGDQDAVKEFVADFQSQGYKIRYRMPADPADWTKNVESFDVLALFSARPFFLQDKPTLDEQLQKIRQRGIGYRNKLFKDMWRERLDRAQRYDSIANFLEPNIKYGPGGLRDLEQGLMIYELFNFSADGQKNVNSGAKIDSNAVTIKELQKKLTAYKSYLLLIRHYLHLNGGNEVMTSALQSEISQFVKAKSLKEFMGELEVVLSEVSFYADGLAELAQAPKKKLQTWSTLKLKTLEHALKVLKHNNSWCVQNRIRQSSLKWPDKKNVGALIEKYFHSGATDDFVTGLFRSQLLHKISPDLQRVRGLVQHDQYHRYSVDAHSLQAIREVLRVKAKPKILGDLGVYTKRLNQADWDDLLWTALYHDLGKGLSGDHSNEGEQIVKRDFINMGISLKRTTQVAWLVHSHLLLSGAAFRQNPTDPGTWAELFRYGVKGQKIFKLALFTAIDIRATNPEAWNEWKERLLVSLIRALLSPGASHLNAFMEWAEKKKVKVDKHFIEKLDTQILAEVAKDALLKDYQKLKTVKHNLSPLIVKVRKNEFWVRFHSDKDRPGLFLNYVGQLHAAGVSVQEASVQTYPDLGVYDWFKVKSARTQTQIQKRLDKTSATILIADKISQIVTPALTVRFEVVEIVAQGENGVVLSFRGKDQRGALLAAAHAIYEVGFEIHSAKVHTWGRQIDDIFTIKKPPVAELEKGLKILAAKLC